MAGLEERRSPRLLEKQLGHVPEELSPQKSARLGGKAGEGAGLETKHAAVLSDIKAQLQSRRGLVPPGSVPDCSRERPSWRRSVPGLEATLVANDEISKRPCPPPASVVRALKAGGQPQNVPAAASQEPQLTPLMNLMQAPQAADGAAQAAPAAVAVQDAAAAAAQRAAAAREAAATPWRVDLNAERPAPRPPVPSLACWSREEPGWRSVEARAAEDCAFRRWTRRAEACAQRHVREAFGRLERHLLAAARRPADGDLSCVLALAGPDCADHDAAMRQAEQLVRHRLPSAHSALLGPEDLQSPASATRQLCAQLMRGAAPAPEREEQEEAEQEEAGDAALAPAGVGMMDYVDWRREQGAAGPAALFVARADAAPKAALREALGCWGAACREGGVPCLVVLGLQHPPQSRFSLLEGEPLVPLRILDALNLFDAKAVCAKLLEQLLGDEQCPLPLPPELFAWLWELFAESRRSVQHTLKAMALLCERLKTESPEAAFAGLFLDVKAASASKSASMTKNLPRIKRALREHMQRAEWPESCKGLKEEQLGEATLEVRAWWKRLAGSLGPWDLLLQRVEPLSRHEPRVRRFARLLRGLSPQEGGEEGSAEDSRQGGELGRKCLAVLDSGDRQLSKEALQDLLADLLASSESLDPALKQMLMGFCEQQLEGEKLRQGLKMFYVKHRYGKWYKQLGGDARALFLVLVPRARALPEQLARSLACGESLAVDGQLLPLARSSSGSMADAALLYRLIQATPGKSLAVRDIWKAFSTQLEQASGQGAERAQARFGTGLVALQMMGLLSARGSSAGVSGDAFRGWRLRRRHFGRAWLRRAAAPAAPALAQAPEPAAIADADPGDAPPAPAPAQPQRPRLPPWCVWSGARALLAPGSSAEQALAQKKGEKRPMVQPPRLQGDGKRRHKEKKQRCKMFMS